MPAGRRKRTEGDFDHLPAVGADLDRAPARIGEVETDAAGLLGEADVDRPLRSIELGSGLDEQALSDIDGRGGLPQSPRSGAGAANPQPLATDGPGFPAAVK